MNSFGIPKSFEGLQLPGEGVDHELPFVSVSMSSQSSSSCPSSTPSQMASSCPSIPRAACMSQVGEKDPVLQTLGTSVLIIGSCFRSQRHRSGRQPSSRLLPPPEAPLPSAEVTNPQEIARASVFFFPPSCFTFPLPGARQ